MLARSVLRCAAPLRQVLPPLRQLNNYKACISTAMHVFSIRIVIASVTDDPV